MPLPARLFVRASLVWLALGFTLGAALLAAKATPMGDWPPLLLPLHHAWLLLGFSLQLALGVAYWIMPRFGTERGATWQVMASFLLLNSSIALYTAARLVALLYPGNATGPLEGGAGICLVLAAAAFLANAWPRIRELAVQKHQRAEG